MLSNMHEAKTNLSQLVDKVLSGEKVTIAKAGKPLVDLIPHQVRSSRQSGRYKGQIQIADDFDHTPQDIIDLFEKGDL